MQLILARSDRYCWSGVFLLLAATPSLLQGIGWAGRVAQGYEVIGTFIGSFQSTRNILEGRATLFDILPFLPAIGYVLAEASVVRKAGLGFFFDEDGIDPWAIPIDPSPTYPVIVQPGVSDCVPTACRMLLRTFESFGYPVTYTDLYSATTLSGPDSGTPLANIVPILQANGIPSVRYQRLGATIDDLLNAMSEQIPPPVIAIAEISTSSTTLTHAVVIDLVTTARIGGENMQVFQIRDPGDGSIFLYPVQAFGAVFDGLTAVIASAPDPRIDALNRLLGP